SKSIAAFANTFGGLILIGIEEDKNSSRPKAIKGIELRAKVEEQVISSAYQGIYPPVFPEVHVVEIPEAGGQASTRCVVIVRVDESPFAPHAIENKRKVYVRIENQTDPEDLVSIEMLEWLRARR